MATDKNLYVLGIQVDKATYERISKCAEREKRTKRAVVELAVEDYFKKSPASKEGGRK